MLLGKVPGNSEEYVIWFAMGIECRRFVEFSTKISLRKRFLKLVMTIRKGHV